MAPFDRL